MSTVYRYGLTISAIHQGDHYDMVINGTVLDQMWGVAPSDNVAREYATRISRWDAEDMRFYAAHDK
jgi:hypothetical protein